MGISLALADLDEVFRTVTYKVEVINDISTAYLDDKELFQKKVAARFDNDDYISNTPSCVGNHIRGRPYIGMVCPECHTAVEDHLLAQIESKLWMRAPEGVRALVNPEFWIQLTQFFSVGQFSLIQWMLNRHYKPTGKIPHNLVDTVAQLYPDMHYNRFIDEFDTIFPVLLNLKEFRTKAKREKAHWLVQMVAMYRDCLFPQHVPLPARTLSILESSHNRIYYDATVSKHLDVANTLVGIDTEDNSFSVSVREQRTVKAMTLYAEFHEKWIDININVKESLPRRHLAGIRLNFSGRAVIVSISNVHQITDVHLPWSMATGMFRLHIASYLRQMGWSSSEIARHIDAHARKFCPLIHEIFGKLIHYARERGIPLLFGRKPALEKGNLQKMHIVKVKTDPYDYTLELSPQVIKGLGADYDGDACDIGLLLDERMSRFMDALSPHRGVHDMNRPRELSHVQLHPKEVAGNIANYLDDVEEVSEAIQMQTMAEYCCAE